MEAKNVLLRALPEPTLRQRVSAALFIAAFGIDCGIRTKADVMWPYIEFSDDDVKRTAAKLLASVQAAVLEVLPPAQIERISTTLAAYLSFSVGDGSLDDIDPSPEVEAHRQA